MKEKKPKNRFLTFFKWFFGHALLRPLGDTPISFKIKGLIEIHNRVKFHEYSIFASRVINFQMFLQNQKSVF